MAVLANEEGTTPVGARLEKSCCWRRLFTVAEKAIACLWSIEEKLGVVGSVREEISGERRLGRTKSKPGEGDWDASLEDHCGEWLRLKMGMVWKWGRKNSSRGERKFKPGAALLLVWKNQRPGVGVGCVWVF
ncbi:hypothetical protein NC653_008304 [Populus alba x Populus x berolinensis]|uniref:Uncharacterized protein n=1 Tax=Populus alba x Populus x berolinensis TaxID=444605 RepID=A0AAD6R641_9ROSI|nr:hypothetical protein NC653_008304 [Populus alba x Populus x berolinensis]